MVHEMKLNNGPFSKIESGTKRIELRLYDDKRKRIKVGDIIKFTNKDSDSCIRVEVIDLHKFESFEELYKCFDKIFLGYNENDIANYRDMELYYSKEEQDKYGVLGIEIKLI